MQSFYRQRSSVLGTKAVTDRRQLRRSHDRRPDDLATSRTAAAVCGPQRSTEAISLGVGGDKGTSTTRRSPVAPTPNSQNRVSTRANPNTKASSRGHSKKTRLLTKRRSRKSTCSRPRQRCSLSATRHRAGPRFLSGGDPVERRRPEVVSQQGPEPRQRRHPKMGQGGRSDLRECLHSQRRP